LFEEFGFTPDTVVEAARQSIEAVTTPGEPTAPTHPAPSGPAAPADLEADPGATIS
jgi:hypothetical protein